MLERIDSDSCCAQELALIDETHNRAAGWSASPTNSDPLQGWY